MKIPFFKKKEKELPEGMIRQQIIPKGVNPHVRSKEEIYNQLFAAIDRLPERQREVLLLTMEKRKVKEIAEALQISANSVKKQKQRALDTLRDMLTDTQMLLLLQMLS